MLGGGAESDILPPKGRTTNEELHMCMFAGARDGLGNPSNKSDVQGFVGVLLREVEELAGGGAQAQGGYAA